MFLLGGCLVFPVVKLFLFQQKPLNLALVETFPHTVAQKHTQKKSFATGNRFHSKHLPYLTGTPLKASSRED